VFSHFQANTSSVLHFVEFPAWEKGAMKFITERVPKGERVLHLAFHEFPALFFRDRSHSYLMGLDPMFGYATHPEETVYLQRLWYGEVPPDPGEMSRRLGGHVLIIDKTRKPMHRPFSIFVQSGGAKKVYDDSMASVYFLPKRDEPLSRRLDSPTRLEPKEALHLCHYVILQKDKGHSELMVLLLNHTDAEVRRSAGHALVRLGAKEHIEPISRLLNDPDPFARSMGPLALSSLGSKAHAKNIAASLKDPDAEVRKSSAWALACLGSEEYADDLVALLEDPTPSVRKSAAWSLGWIGSKKHSSALSRQLQDSSDIGAQAILSLMKVDAPVLEPELHRLSSHNDDQVRMAANIALVRAGKKGVPAHLELLRDVSKLRPYLKYALHWALLYAHEPGGATKLSSVQETDEAVDSFEGFNKLLGRRGISIDPGEEQEFCGTMEKGTRVSALVMFETRVEGGVPVIEGDRAWILNVDQALQYWEKRLSR
jgi:hypothetical protein